MREMIVANIRMALELGALSRAADLLLVLRVFLGDRPEAQLSPRFCEARYSEFAVDPTLSLIGSLYPNITFIPEATKH